MALEKRTEYTHTIKANGNIDVQQDDQIWEDDVFIAHAFYRHVLHPGEDTSQEDERGKIIAAAVHTPKVIAAWERAEAASRI